MENTVKSPAEIREEFVNDLAMMVRHSMSDAPIKDSWLSMAIAHAELLFNYNEVSPDDKNFLIDMIHNMRGSANIVTNYFRYVACMWLVYGWVLTMNT